MKRQAKAIVAAAIAGLGTAAAASAGGMTTAEYLTVASAALVAYQGVYWTGPRGGRVDPS